MQSNVRNLQSRYSPARVDLRNPHGVNAWCRHFGVSRPQLFAAVACVGSNPDVVRGYLCRVDFASSRGGGNLPVAVALRRA